MNDVSQSHLGKETVYPDQYDPNQLFPIARLLNRENIGIDKKLPFHGYDLWNAFEISWLNEKGKPQVAIMEASFPAESSHLIESKSFKLYLNSFNNTCFASQDIVAQTIKRDLSEAACAQAEVNLYALEDYAIELRHGPEGHCIDDLDITCDPTHVHAAHLLQTTDEIVSETLYSNLLKSNCPVTNQPDWGTVVIEYTGALIQHDSLLAYIVSFRNHNEFHEQCVERIFVDLMKHCQLTSLTVSARYTRRGGLDINPIRSTEKNPKLGRYRLVRQ